MAILGNWREATPRSKAIDNALESFKKFLRSQVIGAIVLLICAVIAIIWANSPWAESYFRLWETELSFKLGELSFALTLHQWVNEALMMAFFLLVGLEVKEQALVGELSSIRHALLPIGAAIGGMIVPALIYAMINSGGEGGAGWGIPMSTDIAFALGILALLGKRVPLSLKVFLAALAIADDIGAILVITLFYTNTIAINGLLIALLFWLLIFALGRVGIYNPLIYFGLSLGVWCGFYVSGIHATIAGVLVAIAIPAHSLMDPKRFVKTLKKHWQELDERLPSIDLRSGLHDKQHAEAVETLAAAVHNIDPPLKQLEHSLQPWVTYIVMPLFALSNAGVAINGDIVNTITSPVSIGIILGLVLGKQIGITLFAWLMVRFGIAKLPSGITIRHIHAVSLLAGIGFTVALFVTELAFVGQHQLGDEGKLGILLASFVAGVVGYTMLRSITSETTEALQPALAVTTST